MKATQAEIYLLGIVVIWGATFAIVKSILDQIMPFTFLAYRFFWATFILGLIFWRRLKNVDRAILNKGFLIGIFLFLGFAFQTVGLKYTIATKAGFITGLAVALVPIISHFFIREKISKNSILGVTLAVMGLWCLNCNSSFIFNFGDFLILLCAVSFAMQIILVSLYVRKLDYVLLVIVQLTTVCVLSFLMALFFERPGIHLCYPYGVWRSIILTGIFATALAFYIQSRFQRYSTATKTAIIFSVEPIFSAMFAYLLLGEKVGLIAWIGGLLIILGMIVSQRE